MSVLVANDAFDNGLFEGASCAFGVFDGLHIGHRYLIDRALDTCDAGKRAVIVTFDRDPDEVFHPDRLKKLMRNEDRVRALAETGADDVVVLEFNSKLYSKQPMEFLGDLFACAVPDHMHIGEDFRFGARASGTVATLDGWGRDNGCAVHAHSLVSADGMPVTSTRIRTLLEACDVKAAAQLLGRPYRLAETVRKGRGEGADFGFATANLNVKPIEKALGDGVYAAYAHIEEATYKAAVSVGVSPTFEEASTANVEAHVLDFEGDLVDKEISLDFVEFLRPMMKFATTDELIRTVTSNINWVRENL